VTGGYPNPERRNIRPPHSTSNNIPGQVPTWSLQGRYLGCAVAGVGEVDQNPRTSCLGRRLALDIQQCWYTISGWLDWAEGPSVCATIRSPRHLRHLCRGSRLHVHRPCRWHPSRHQVHGRESVAGSAGANGDVSVGKSIQPTLHPHLKRVLANEVSARVESLFRPSLNSDEFSMLADFVL